MSDGIELERVVRVGARGRHTGRTHLTALVPDLGDVRTLCGQRFPAAAAEAVEVPADCQPCLRRRTNPALVSAALFEAGLGSKLLELSLEQVGQRAARPAGRPRLVKGAEPRRAPGAQSRPGPPSRPAGEPRARDPVKTSAPPAETGGEATSPPRLRLERPGELRAAGLKEIGEDLYRSPAGVVIRLRRREDRWYVAELVHEGSVIVRRRSESQLELRVGDIQVEIEAEGGAIRAIYSLG